MSGLRSHLVVIGALGARAVRQALRRPQLMAPVVIFPSLLLAINVGGAGRAVELPGFPEVHGYLDFVLAGGILQATMMAGLSGGIAMALDIEMGFTDRLVAAPIPRYAIVLGRLAGTSVLGLFIGAWFLAAGLIFGAHIAGGVGGVLMILAMSPLAAVAFGSIACSIALRSGRVSTTQGVFPLVFVVLFLSTAFFPAALMAEPAGSIALYNPFSLIADGIREPIIATLSGTDLMQALAAIGGIGALGLSLCGVALQGRLRSGG